MRRLARDDEQSRCRDLLQDYPRLIERCREWQCSYSEAIIRIEAEREKRGLLRFINEPDR